MIFTGVAMVDNVRIKNNFGYGSSLDLDSLISKLRKAHEIWTSEFERQSNGTPEGDNFGDFVLQGFRACFIDKSTEEIKNSLSYFKELNISENEIKIVLVNDGASYEWYCQVNSENPDKAIQEDAKKVKNILLAGLKQVGFDVIEYISDWGA